MGASSSGSSSASESEAGSSSTKVRLRFREVEGLLGSVVVGGLRLRHRGDLWAGSRVDQSSRG